MQWYVYVKDGHVEQCSALRVNSQRHKADTLREHCSIAFSTLAKENDGEQLAHGCHAVASDTQHLVNATGVEPVMFRTRDDCSTRQVDEAVAVCAFCSQNAAMGRDTL